LKFNFYLPKSPKNIYFLQKFDMQMGNHKDDYLNSNLGTDEILSCLQIGKLLTSTLDLSTILELIISKMSQLVEAENWSLLLKDENSEELTFDVVVGIDKESVKDIRIPLGVGVAGKVAESGESIFIADALNDPRILRKVDTKTGFKTKSLICIPLKIHGKVLGVIEIINVEDIEKFKAKKFPSLSILSDYAAIAIENSQYIKKIQRLSITDEYTGLYNARYMHEILPRLIQESESKKQRFAVAFMDVDNFKLVVDTFGHLSGSKVLDEIGKTVSGCLGENDILIKYGGDEFIIILQGIDKFQAIKLLKKILKKIKYSTYLESENVSIKVTASFGLAIYPDDARTKKDLLIRADNNMYKIKKSSKNDIGFN
jgi:diguanylate cyclase (GGDEF)-like protein